MARTVPEPSAADGFVRMVADVTDDDTLALVSYWGELHGEVVLMVAQVLMCSLCDN